MRGRSLALCVLLALASCSGPPREPCNADPPRGSLGSVCGFENPEDLDYIPGAELLLVSEMRRDGRGGALAVLPLDETGRPSAAPRRLWPEGGGAQPDGRGQPGCDAPPAAELFAPHGLHAGRRREQTVPVAVVNHGGRESVELFDLQGDSESLRLIWRGCVPLPAGVRGNDVALSRDGWLAASNYEPAGGRWRATWSAIRGGLGRVTGDIRVWQAETGWRPLPDSDAANPNGVAWDRDAGQVFFAETGSGTVRRAPLQPDGAGDADRDGIEIGGRPDALAWSRLGSLLAVTHLSGLDVLLCRWGARPCRSAWALIAIEPDLSSAVELFRHDGDELGAASSAAHVGTRFYVGAVFDDRIGVFELPR